MFNFISDLLNWAKFKIWGAAEESKKRKLCMLDARENIFSPNVKRQKRFFDPQVLPVTPLSPSSSCSSSDFVASPSRTVSMSSKSGYHCSRECETSGEK